MADAIVSILLEKLSTLLSQKYTQLIGLEKDVKYIMDELASMRGFLRNAEAKQDHDILDAEQQVWIKQVRETAYDMEDVVDYFLLQFTHRGATGFLAYVCHKYNSIKNLSARERITSKIRDIRERVEQIAARHQKYQSTDKMVGTTTTSPYHPIRGDALLLKEDDLVGIVEPKHEIISLIIDKNSHMKAISVVGMGGSGKTTLVKRVFETPIVKNAFSINAWLTISQTFQIETTLKNLIKQIKFGSEVDSMDAEGLMAFAKNILKEEMYIIVLDGLWRLDDWNSIKYVFPDDRDGCLLITTQNEDVENACCKQFHGKVHKMKKLSADDSLELFCRKTFKEDSCPPHLISITNNILTKCDGLPLGIALIGGLLAMKDTLEWDMVLQSIGTELEGIGRLTPITKILFLSYNELPHSLKSCFLYMGIFHVHDSIDIEELAFLWIAEGFAKARSGVTAMEVALSYLDELISRGLIQVEKIELDGRIQSCRVHDLIYEIILSKCKEHNILTPAIIPHTAWPEKVRRLRVDDSTCPKEPFPLLHLRSLFKNKFLSDSSLSILFHGNPKLIKVLDLRDVNIGTIPKKVFELLNLTHLNLSNTDITNVPKSIGKLQNLEYLNIEYTRVEDLPTDITKLNKLCCLYIPQVNRISSKILGGLNSLQYLRRMNMYTKEAIQEIGKLTQLRELHIAFHILCNGRELCSSLENLINLQRLVIEFYENEIVHMIYSFTLPLKFLYYLYLGGPLVQIPDWITSCHSLSTLYLSQSSLREDPLESLADLSNLVKLCIYNDEYVGKMLHFKDGGFIWGFPDVTHLSQRNMKLTLSLHLRRLPKLESVIFEEGALSDLETLGIQGCELMKKRPQGIPYLRKLNREVYSNNGWSSSSYY